MSTVNYFHPKRQIKSIAAKFKMKKLGIASTLIYFSITAYAAVFSNDELAEKANLLNNNLPISIDNNLILNNVLYRQGRILEYHFQLNKDNFFSEMAHQLNISIDNLKNLLAQEHGSLKNALKVSVNELAKDITNNICSGKNKELKNFIFDGIELKYDYYDEGGVYISSSFFKKEMCIK